MVKNLTHIKNKIIAARAAANDKVEWEGELRPIVEDIIGAIEHGENPETFVYEMTAGGEVYIDFTPYLGTKGIKFMKITNLAAAASYVWLNSSSAEGAPAGNEPTDSFYYEKGSLLANQVMSFELSEPFCPKQGWIYVYSDTALRFEFIMVDAPQITVAQSLQNIEMVPLHNRKLYFDAGEGYGITTPEAGSGNYNELGTGLDFQRTRKGLQNVVRGPFISVFNQNDIVGPIAGTPWAGTGGAAGTGWHADMQALYTRQQLRLKPLTSFTYFLKATSDFPAATNRAYMDVGSNVGNAAGEELKLGTDAAIKFAGALMCNYSRFDFSPDNGSMKKTYTGYYCLYGGAVSWKGAAGSTFENFAFYTAGVTQAYGGTVSKMYGYYCAAMKIASITNTYAFYAEGANDRNYFAGKTQIGAGAETADALNVYGDARISGNVVLTLPTYADNAAALTGGLTTGRLYKTATGQVMIVL